MLRSARLLQSADGFNWISSTLNPGDLDVIVAPELDLVQPALLVRDGGILRFSLRNVDTAVTAARLSVTVGGALCQIQLATTTVLECLAPPSWMVGNTDEAPVSASFGAAAGVARAIALSGPGHVTYLDGVRVESFYPSRITAGATTQLRIDLQNAVSWLSAAPGIETECNVGSLITANATIDAKDGSVRCDVPRQLVPDSPIFVQVNLYAGNGLLLTSS